MCSASSLLSSKQVRSRWGTGLSLVMPLALQLSAGRAFRAQNLARLQVQTHLHEVGSCNSSASISRRCPSRSPKLDKRQREAFRSLSEPFGSCSTARQVPTDPESRKLECGICIGQWLEEEPLSAKRAPKSAGASVWLGFCWPEGG